MQVAKESIILYVHLLTPSSTSLTTVSTAPKIRMIQIHHRMLSLPNKFEIVRKLHMLHPRVSFPCKAIRHILLHVQRPALVILQIQVSTHHRIPDAALNPLK
jgi:hypothetical protein